MSIYSYLPHKNSDLWKKAKEKFKQCPKNIKMKEMNL